MPNWCSNCISFEGTEKAMQTLKKDVASIKDAHCLFTALTDIKSEWSYDVWNAEFGTKWSVRMDDDIRETMEQHDYFNCETAWSPCTEFVRKVCKKYGVNGRIEYSEPGCDFAGIVEIDENGDEMSREEMTCMQMDYNADWNYFLEKFTDNVNDGDYDDGVYENDEEIRSTFFYVTDEEIEIMLEIYRKGSPAEN